MLRHISRAGVTLYGQRFDQHRELCLVTAFSRSTSWASVSRAGKPNICRLTVREDWRWVCTRVCSRAVWQGKFLFLEEKEFVSVGTIVMQPVFLLSRCFLERSEIDKIAKLSRQKAFEYGLRLLLSRGLESLSQSDPTPRDFI